MPIPAEILPVLYGLLAAFLYGLGAQFQYVGLSYMEPRGGAAITIAASALFYLAAAPFLLEPAHLLHPAVLIFVLVGLFRPALSANLALAGMKHLGPTLGSTLASTSPLFGAAFGVLWLGEALTWPAAAGTAAIVLAIAMLARRDGRTAADWPAWALLLPVGAAAIRAAAHVLSKVGMESIPDPYFAGLVGFVVSALVSQAAHKARRDAPPVRWIGRGAAWFVGASACFCLATFALNTALLTGDVVRVVPVVAAAPVFTLILSAAIFRRERLTVRVLAAVALVVPAVALIAAAG